MITLYALVDHPGPRLPTFAELTTAPLDGLAFVCGPAGEPSAAPERLWEQSFTRDIVDARMLAAMKPSALARISGVILLLRFM